MSLDETTHGRMSRASTMAASCHLLSIAPMIRWTHTHFRQLMRLIAPHALLYTEMEPLQAVLRLQKKALTFDPIEHPIALQIGGSDLAGWVEATRLAAQYQFDEININLGCPSPRVQKGRFGACLMREGDHVAACVRAMKAASTGIAVTVKMRTGVDELDSQDFFMHLAGQLIEAGVDKLIIHARKAWLKGLSPKQNRTIPPLQYAYVHQLKATYPNVPIVLNGQVNDLELIHQQLSLVDGIMIGRLAYENPYQLAIIHQSLYPERPIQSREAVIQVYVQKMQHEVTVPLSILCQPLLNMYHGIPHAKTWKAAVMAVIKQQEHRQLPALGRVYL